MPKHTIEEERRRIAEVEKAAKKMAKVAAKIMKQVNTAKTALRKKKKTGGCGCGCGK